MSGLDFSSDELPRSLHLPSAVFLHARALLKFVNADAEADAQLGGQMRRLGGGALASGSGASVLSADLFPQLNAINKDKGHDK